MYVYAISWSGFVLKICLFVLFLTFCSSICKTKILASKGLCVEGNKLQNQLAVQLNSSFPSSPRKDERKQVLQYDDVVHLLDDLSDLENAKRQVAAYLMAALTILTET